MLDELEHGMTGQGDTAGRDREVAASLPTAIHDGRRFLGMRSRSHAVASSAGRRN